MSIEYLRYAVKEMSQNYQNKSWWRSRFISNVVGPTVSALNESGDNFFEEDWDNLFLLDAARADLFEDAVDTNAFDSYSRTLSPGSSSAEWMRECFGDTKYPDVVYVSGNPWVSRIGANSFHKVYNLWVDEFGLEENAEAEENILKDHDPKGWGTIQAEWLAEVAYEAHQEYPDKRLVVHFFQPHAPCIGNADGTVKNEVDHTIGPGQNLRAGRVTRERVWDAYIDNLKYALTHAKELAENVGGKTVYSADHGELMGEWLFPFPMRGYAHPSYLHHKKLLEVPWAVETHGERREINAGDVEERDFDQSEIDNRLKDLGYL